MNMHIYKLNKLYLFLIVESGYFINLALNLLTFAPFSF